VVCITPKLSEIAERIAAHLARMEAADPGRGSAAGRYWNASAWTAGSRVGVRYVSYQFAWKLTKADALVYLKWLDAGNVGKHFDAARISPAVSEPTPERLLSQH